MSKQGVEFEFREGGLPKWRIDRLRGDRRFGELWETLGEKMTEQAIALARLALDRGWSVQDAADLVVAWSARHDAKVDFPREAVEYVLSEAFERFERETAEGWLRSLAKDSQVDREEVRRNFSLFLGCEVLHVYQHGRTNSVYSIVARDQDGEGEIMIGTVNQLFQLGHVRGVLFEAQKIFLSERIKGPEWTKIVGQALSHLVEVVEAMDGSWSSILDDYLRRYLSGQQWLASDSTEAGTDQAFLERAPFREGGVTYFSSEHLAHWLQRWGYERLPPVRLPWLLRSCGIEKRRVSRRIEGKVISRNLWLLSPERTRRIFGEEEEAAEVPVVPMGEKRQT